MPPMIPIKPAVTLFVFFSLLIQSPVIISSQQLRKLDETPTGEIKCGGCSSCSNPCAQSPPPPSPPPPPPSPPKKPPTVKCPPPPAPYIYITAPPGDLYPVDPYYYGSAGRAAVGLVAFVSSVFGLLVVGFW
uniref:Uncharacterized protein n=1 Tax=Kalanchoe fedtschenkoi TaxID=63787 RepID=A0A7N0UCQ9_KALFE